MDKTTLAVGSLGCAVAFLFYWNAGQRRHMRTIESELFAAVRTQREEKQTLKTLRGRVHRMNEYAPPTPYEHEMRRIRGNNGCKRV